MGTWSINLKKIVNRADFSDQFRKKYIGYNTIVMRQSACLVVQLMTVFNLLNADWSHVRLLDRPNIKLFKLF